MQALTIHRTTVGKKAIMAVTGVALFGFLIAHLVGNLQVFLGPDRLNEYAAWLRTLPTGLWAARFGLLASLLLHIWAAVALANRNADARPTEYRSRYKRRDQVTDYAARTMMWSGPIVGLYVVFHLLHLTFGYDMGAGRFDHHNVYNNVVYGFLEWKISTAYIVANILLGMHLWHGCWSMFQSLGLNHVRYNPLRRVFAWGVAGFITLGNVGIPVGVMAGAVEPTDREFCYPELAAEPGECDGFEGGE